MDNKKIKILIAEDEETLRQMYLTKFKANGFEVFEAKNGLEALETIQKVKPDIVLLDIIMPLADGFSILKKIKKDEILKNIPVILLTNLSQNSDMRTGKNLGAADYLVKTEFTPSQLVEKVKGFLQISRRT